MQYGNDGNSTHPNDGSNYGNFLQLLRKQLNERGMEAVTITACITGDASKMSALPFKIMATVLESISIMTYDFLSSSWGPTITGHHTNLKSTPYSQLSVEKAVDACIAAGVPCEKLVIGAALYSRGFANTDGLGHPSQGVVPDKSWEEGVLDYKDIPPVGAVEHYDSEAQAAYSYDSQRRILTSYDNVQSVQAKCKFVHDRNLKGIIVWESAGDFPANHPRSLISALHRGLFLNAH